MNSRDAKAQACHIVTLWMDTNLGEGTLQNWCDELGDDDADRLCEGMRQLRVELGRRAGRTD